MVVPCCMQGVRVSKDDVDVVAGVQDMMLGCGSEDGVDDARRPRHDGRVRE